MCECISEPGFIDGASVDGGAAEALRVVEHFDALVDQRSTAVAMLRSTVQIADCPAGLEDPERGLRMSIDACGRILADADGHGTSRHTFQFQGSTVWLDRDGRCTPRDRLILERFARSLHAVKAPRDISPAAAALRIACDPNSPSVDRDYALVKLGVGARAVVVVTHAADARYLPGGLFIDDHQVHLFPESMAPNTIPAGIPAGIDICPAADVSQGRLRARTALRVAVDLATGRPAHVHYDQLGCVATVVETVGSEIAADVPDVRRMSEVQIQRPWALATLEAVMNHTSIREAARMQNLHHSTVRQRINWIERQLGYPLFSAAGCARTSIALTLWRIARAAEQQASSPTATAACR